MSGWDWLHAGLQVATYTKAQQAKRELDSMKTAAEIEAARRALLDAMRSLIFDISRDIQLAEEQLEEFPQQVYIVAQSLDLRLAQSRLSPEAFPDFQDKEYVLATEKRVAGVVEDAKARLQPEEVNDSDRAVKYIAEMPMLEEAISAKSAQESLRATDEQWNELDIRQKSRNTTAWLSFIGLAISACLCYPLTALGSSLFSTGNFFYIILSLFVFAIALAIPGGAIALLVKRSKPNPEYKPLKDKRQRWREQLMSKDDWEQITSTFGDLSSEEFIAVRDERLAFLYPLLGDDFRKHLTAGETTLAAA